jgi:hypothetical protein
MEELLISTHRQINQVACKVRKVGKPDEGWDTHMDFHCHNFYIALSLNEDFQIPRYLFCEEILLLKSQLQELILDDILSSSLSPKSICGF